MSLRHTDAPRTVVSRDFWAGCDLVVWVPGFPSQVIDHFWQTVSSTIWVFWGSAFFPDRLHATTFSSILFDSSLFSLSTRQYFLQNKHSSQERKPCSCIILIVFFFCSWNIDAGTYFSWVYVVTFCLCLPYIAYCYYMIITTVKQQQRQTLKMAGEDAVSNNFCCVDVMMYAISFCIPSAKFIGVIELWNLSFWASDFVWCV